MVKVSEIAHDTAGELIRLTDSDVSLLGGHIPDLPADDYNMASKAVWMLCLAKAKHQRGSRIKEYETENRGKPGVIWEGWLVSAMREIWPQLTIKESNSFRTACYINYGQGNFENLVHGTNIVPAQWWIAYEFTPHPVNRASTKHSTRRKVKLSQPKKSKPEIEVETVESLDKEFEPIPVKDPEVIPEIAPALSVGSELDGIIKALIEAKSFAEKKGALLAFVQEHANATAYSFSAIMSMIEGM